ncbi:MAG: formylglycine-generating enzyme family protein [Chloroflexaceae bacterium]|nr:formylglycine-generating enzyme family protein [Chloroflexaceae bacterium]
MNEKPRQTLCTIIRDYGRTVAQDPKRCKALLLDLCGEHRREINVLVSAMDERIASDLLNLPPNIPPQMRMPQLVKRLHDHTAIAEPAARWAVESWALALGVIQEHDLVEKREERERREREERERREREEQERKQREEQERKQREEQERKQWEERERKERERKEQERKERKEQERKEREEQERKEREERERMARERPDVYALPPAMVKIKGGTFVIGKEKKWTIFGEKADFEGNPVKVAAFEIARYPITNAQYELFMDDDGYNPTRPWWDEAGRAWLKKEPVKEPRHWGDKRPGIARADHPVAGVSWYEAVAFCRWLTRKMNDRYIYRLPTEAEWEYAARRNTGRRFPWGNKEPDHERANYNDNYRGTTAVGSFPKGATPDGIYDLAGNVWEWTGSIYTPYPYDPKDGRENLSAPSGKRFVVRGGGWLLLSVFLRASFRYDLPPDARYVDNGFRPARHLP